jgi:4-amino-4-deoxy-L-arabinose transferase-like glycosyltransferase
MSLGWFRSNYLLVVLCALVLTVRVVTAWPLQQPGYMDAYYYYNVAEGLYRGEGFTDHYLWNFLDDPAGIPRPACLYWMPFTSIIIYPFFLLFGPSFHVAQLPFILLSTCLVLIAYRVGLDLSASRRQAALAAGLVALSGFYTVFWVVPDNFAPFAVVGSLALYAAGQGVKTNRRVWFAFSGLLAGLAHLTRADGLLILVAVILACLLSGWWITERRRDTIYACLWCLLAYGLVMAPWFYRNWLATGTALASGGLQTLFLRSYDDLFSYGRELTWQSYLAWGWLPILRSKVEAVWFGVTNLLVVNLMIFLAPLTLVGLWAWRKKTELLPVLLYAVLLYAGMTVGFTFPGIRGGLFHSSAALLPWLFAVAACGLELFVEFMARHRRGWESDQARRFFSVSLIVLAALLSGFLYLRSVRGQAGGSLPWNQRDGVYVEVGRWLDEKADGNIRVMVNNSPAFYYHTHRSCISIPNEELEVVLKAAHRYQVSYLVLEDDHPRPLKDLYEGRRSAPEVQLALTLQDGRGLPVKIYHLEVGP